MKDIVRRAQAYSRAQAIQSYSYCGYVTGATEQRKIDMKRLKEVLNMLMIDTKDKAEIIKLMEE